MVLYYLIQHWFYYPFDLATLEDGVALQAYAEHISN